MNQQSTFGVNVWWSLPETSVDGSLAQTLLEKHGFEATDIRLPTRLAEVSRAAYSFQDRRSKSNRRVTEKALESGESVIYGILDREQDGEEVSFSQNTTVRMDKDTGVVAVNGVLKDAFMKALGEFQGKITDDDIRMFLRRVIRMCYGVPKRPSGGIYFIPAKFVQIIEQAKSALEEFNTSAKLYVERVMDGQQERANVWEAVEAEAEARVAEAVAAIGRIERRVSAVEGQKAKIDSAEDLMKVYQSLLGEEAKYESLAEKIEDAVRAVSEKMAKLSPAAQVVATQQKVAKVANMPSNAKSKSGITVAEATVQVLTKAGKALSCREIVEEAIRSGLYATDSTNPYNSFNGTLLRAIKMGDNRVKRVGRGVYEIATVAA